MITVPHIIYHETRDLGLKWPCLCLYNHPSMSNSESENTQDNLILRDYLAIDRTRMANKRTFLAYVRTSLMLMGSGVSVIKLFSTDTFSLVIGISLSISSLIIAIVGLKEYMDMKTRLLYGEKSISNNS